jgi:anti-sigma B factor antagonist
VVTPDANGSAPPVVSSEVLSSHGAVVLVDGDLDLETAPELERHLTTRIAEGHHHLVLDLTAATFFDSTAMQALLRTLAPLQDNADAAVVLAGLQGVVERSFVVSGIDQMFTSFPTRDAAIDAITAPARPLREDWRAVRRPPSA